MSKSKRVQNFVTGLLLIAGGLILAIVPDIGYLVIDIALAAIFLLSGIRLFVYYISIARYAVDGVMFFYRSVIFMDLGLFAVSIMDMPSHYVMVYIMAGFAVAGAIDIIHAAGLKRIASPVWKANLVQGIICVILPLISLIFYTDSELMYIAYGISVIYRGIGKIISAFRRTAIVYVGE